MVVLSLRTNRNQIYGIPANQFSPSAGHPVVVDLVFFIHFPLPKKNSLDERMVSGHKIKV